MLTLQSFGIFLIFAGALNAAIGACLDTTIPCAALSALLPGKVSYPATPTYLASITSYFWGQEKLAPACIVTPTRAQDVSIAVRALAAIHAYDRNAPPFAIRSGGHSPLTGSANYNGGVTMDLTSLNSITISGDKSVVSVGAGSLWQNIYAQLDPLGIAVGGGRVAGIGVGGFLTGGGISFFSPQFGWACDQVVGMQVVLATGQIVNASRTSYPDLFQALKGGSNNFGVVVSFDLQTFPLGNFLGGISVNPFSTLPQQLQAFNGFMQPSNFDPKATVIQAYVYSSASQQTLVSNDIEYAAPETSPAAVQPFLSIQPQYYSSMRISSLLDFVTEQAAFEPVNGRAIYLNTVFSPTIPILQQIVSLWNATIPSVSLVTGLGYNLVFQRIPTTVPSAANSLGLPSNAGSLVLCLLSVSWDLASDDTLMYGVTQGLLGQIETATKAAGVFNAFKYLNYAAGSQDPISGYGAASKSNLQSVSKKYDPSGFFQTGVPGGFKLFPAGSGGS